MDIKQIEATINGLKQRLNSDGTLNVQREEGYVFQAKCTFNSPVTEEEIHQFEKDTNWKLPMSFKQFLLKNNGARLFKHVKCGGGYELLGLDEIRDNHLDYMPEKWYPISINNGDYLFIDSSKVEKGKDDYLVYFEHDSDICPENGRRILLNFETWLDRLIVSQGAEFWSWS